MDKKCLDKILNSPFSEKASHRYIRLGRDSNNFDKILVIPSSWFSNNSLRLPSEKTKLLLRYEFFSNGKYHLKKEEFITASDLSRFTH